MLHNASSSRRRPLRGFTLAELLIVIAIIAVLISILLPSLSAARRAANASKCLASLRDLGLAFQQYAQDNKRAFPVVEWSPPNPGSTVTDGIQRRPWSYFIFKYIHKKNLDPTDPIYKDLGSVRGKSTIWGCPEANAESIWTSTATALPGTASFDYTVPNYWNTGYGMNRYGLAPMLPAGFANPNNYPVITNLQVAGQPAPNVAIVRDPVLAGPFLKMEQWSKRGAEKCLLADSNCFEVITSNQPPKEGIDFGTAAGQIKGPPFINSLATAGTIYIMADWTRHISPSSSIKKAGAARGINVLFADGHAGSLNPKELWIACRGGGVDIR